MVQKNLKTLPSTNIFVGIVLVIFTWIAGTIAWFIPRSFYPKKNVQNQKILITGAASGIGRLMAIRFYKLGAKLILLDINETGLNETVEILQSHKKSDDKRVWSYKVDLSSRDEIYDVAKRILNDVSEIDILINNAGMVTGKLLLDIPDKGIEMTFRVNVLAHFWMLKAFLPNMIERKRGHIVTIASLAGIFGSAHLTDYCASKFANIGMHNSLRLELMFKNLQCIKTLIVKPFLINTGMFDGATPGVFSRLQPDYVADEIVKAILTEQEELEITKALGLLARFQQMIPVKTAHLLYDCLGSYEMFANVTGRLPKPKEEIATNNNNHQSH